MTLFIKILDLLGKAFLLGIAIVMVISMFALAIHAVEVVTK